MDVLKIHMADYGRPVSLYSDRHGIFRMNQEEAKSDDTSSLDGNGDHARLALELRLINLAPPAKGFAVDVMISGIGGFRQSTGLPGFNVRLLFFRTHYLRSSGGYKSSRITGLYGEN